MNEKRSWTQRIKDVFGPGDDKEEKEIQRTLHKMGIDFLKDQKLEHRIKLLIEFQEMISGPIQTDDLVEYVQEIKERQEIFNGAIYQISAPYARSLDFPQIGKAFHGWARLNASASSWIIRTSDTVAKVENGKDKPKPKETPGKPKQKPEAKQDSKIEQKTEQKVQEPAEEDQDKADDLHVEQLLKEMETETIDPRMLVQCLHDTLQKHIWKDGFVILARCFMDRDVSPRAVTVIQNVNAQREREDMRSESDF